VHTPHWSSTSPLQLQVPEAIPPPSHTPQRSTTLPLFATLSHPAQLEPSPPHTPHVSTTSPPQLHLPVGMPEPPQKPHSSTVSPLQLHLPAGKPGPSHTPQTSITFPLLGSPSQPMGTSMMVSPAEQLLHVVAVRTVYQYNISVYKLAYRCRYRNTHICTKLMATTTSIDTRQNETSIQSYKRTRCRRKLARPAITASGGPWYQKSQYRTLEVGEIKLVYTEL
jgi:hypothetical protein